MPPHRSTTTRRTPSDKDIQNGANRPQVRVSPIKRPARAFPNRFAGTSVETSFSHIQHDSDEEESNPFRDILSKDKEQTPSLGMDRRSGVAKGMKTKAETKISSRSRRSGKGRSDPAHGLSQGVPSLQQDLAIQPHASAHGSRIHRVLAPETPIENATTTTSSNRLKRHRSDHDAAEQCKISSRRMIVGPSAPILASSVPVTVSQDGIADEMEPSMPVVVSQDGIADEMEPSMPVIVSQEVDEMEPSMPVIVSHDDDVDEMEPSMPVMLSQDDITNEMEHSMPVMVSQSDSSYDENEPSMPVVASPNGRYHDDTEPSMPVVVSQDPHDEVIQPSMPVVVSKDYIEPSMPEEISTNGTDVTPSQPSDIQMTQSESLDHPHSTTQTQSQSHRSGSQTQSQRSESSLKTQTQSQHSEYSLISQSQDSIYLAIPYHHDDNDESYTYSQMHNLVANQQSGWKRVVPVIYSADKWEKRPVMRNCFVSSKDPPARDSVKVFADKLMRQEMNRSGN
ncbi:unnamed protein product [Sympodiomycopsis kandeliae]